MINIPETIAIADKSGQLKKCSRLTPIPPTTFFARTIQLAEMSGDETSIVATLRFSFAFLEEMSGYRDRPTDGKDTGTEDFVPGL